jgi:nucleoside-diphosphate-sugar epimerase
MRILVTGGAGLVGRYTVSEFSHAGHEVIAFDRALPAPRLRDVSYRTGDHEVLSDLVELCVGMDAIVHLSAIPSPRYHPSTTVFRTNVMGTFNIHEAAALTGVPLVVSTSSHSAYGFAYHHRLFLPSALPLTEESADLSQDCYGLSKMVGEQIAHAYHRRNGMRVCSVRPPWVIDPEMDRNVLRHMLTSPTVWKGGLFAYIDARDLAVVFRMIAEAPAELIQDEVFNVGADDAFCRESLHTLLPRLDPAFAPLVAGLKSNESMVSSARIKERLGWQARHTWRELIGESI